MSDYRFNERDIPEYDIWGEEIECEQPVSCCPTELTGKKQLYFATLRNRGGERKPKLPKPIPLWQTITRAHRVIRCARLSSLPLHRRALCLIAFAPGRYYLAAAVIAAFAVGPMIAATPQQTDNSDRAGKCSVLAGKTICDGSPWQDKHGMSFPGTAPKKAAKAPKHIKMPLVDTGRVEQVDGCLPDTFYAGLESSGWSPKDVQDEKELYGVCENLYKRHRVN